MGPLILNAEPLLHQAKPTLTSRPLNQTDLKIYETVAETHFFENLGYLLITGTVIYAIFFPFSLILVGTGAFGATAIVIDNWVRASSYIASKPQSSITPPLPVKDKPSSISYSSGSGGGGSSSYPIAPFIPGQRIGIRNPSYDCWIVSILQFVLAVEGLRAHLEKRGPPCIKQAIADYAQAQKNRQTVAPNIDTQQIRTWFADHIPGISRNSYNQEDAHEGLNKLMQIAHAYEPMKMLLQRNLAVMDVNNKIKILTQKSSNNILPVNLDNPWLFSNFEQLINWNLKFEDNHGGGFSRFVDSPKELFFQFARFDWSGTGNKINDAISIPLSFKMPKEWLLPGKAGASYSCHAFIEHTGNILNGGHYISYICGKDGIWWRCDDDKITQVSNSEAAAALGRSYICYFKKSA
jgi:hypothetical protein